LLPLLLVQSVEWLWLIYLVSFIQSTISQFFGPAENALLVRVVGEENLVAANSLNSLNNNLARVIGPSLGGVLAILFDLSGIALIDAATFVVAGGMIALVTTSGQLAKPSAQVGPSRMALWHEWREGLRLVWRESVVALLFVMIILTSLGEGVFSVIFLIWVDKVFGGGTLEVGWFMTAQGVGGILGGFIIGGLGNRVAPFKLLGLGALGIGLLDFALFNYPLFFSEIWLGLLFIFLVGVPAVGFGTGWNTLLQKSVPDGYLGRVFGAYSMVGGLLLLVGTSLAGAIGNRVEPVILLNVQSSVYLLAGLFALVTLGKVSQMRLGGVSQKQAIEPVAGN
jgi:MFS family permease